MEYFVIVIIMIALATLVVLKEQFNIKRAGNKGEKTVRKALNKLGNDYRVFHNVKIKENKRKTEIDSIVVGPNGVFVIEVKNQRGLIKGNDESEFFTQTKTSNSSDTLYENQFKNPVKQLSRHIYFLSNHLKTDHLNPWIESCLVFSNPEAVVKVSSNKVKVVTCKSKKDESLIKAIKKMGTKNALTDKQMLKIIVSIERLMY